MRNYEINYEIMRNYEINIMTMTSGKKDDVILPSVLRNNQNLGFFSKRFRFWKMGASHFQLNYVITDYIIIINDNFLNS